MRSVPIPHRRTPTPCLQDRDCKGPTLYGPERYGSFERRAVDVAAVDARCKAVALFNDASVIDLILHHLITGLFGRCVSVDACDAPLYACRAAPELGDTQDIRSGRRKF